MVIDGYLSLLHKWYFGASTPLHCVQLRSARTDVSNDFNKFSVHPERSEAKPKGETEVWATGSFIATNSNE
jgi:hypothetical protein